MDDKTLQALQEKLTKAVDLKNKIAALDHVLACCNNESGFANIVVNYKNQEELSLVTRFTPKEVHDAFRGGLIVAASALKGKLEEEYKNLE